MATNGDASATAAAPGEAPAPAAGPFADIALSVDAYTLDAASGKRPLRNIELDGTLTYDEPKPPKVTHGEALNRIWNEYPGGLMDLSEAKLRDAGDALPRPEAGTDAAVADDAREKGQFQSPEEMEALRSEVCNNLNNARNELWYIFELSKTLAASAGMAADPPPEPLPSAAPVGKKGKQAKAAAAAAATAAAAGVTPAATAATTPIAEGGPEEGPILPAGTYSATPGSAPSPSDVEAAHALELAIAAKQAALDDCAALLDAAVDELRLVNGASDQWTSDMRALRLGERGRGQWATVPKPDFGGGASGGADAVARDVVVPYALDEAPAAIHARALAAFDLDPRKAHLLQFGARSYLRLRVLVRTGGTGGPRIGSLPYSADGEDARGVRALMEAAQRETLDEDLFSELRAEALRIDAALVEHHSVALLLGADKLTFQLYDTREAPFPPAPHHPVCDALLAQARLGLLHAYRRRKQRIVDGTAAPAPGVSPPPPTSILVPLVHLMQFHGACRVVGPTLDAIRAALASAGLTTALVERHAAADSPDALYAFLAAKAKIDVLGAVYSLELAGCKGVTANITAPSSVSLVTHRAAFVLRDMDALGKIAADALIQQLGPWLYDAVRQHLPLQGAGAAPAGQGEDGEPGAGAGAGASAGTSARAFFDELDGAVVLDAFGALTLSLSPPFTHVGAAFERGVAPYDSRDGGTLVGWLSDAVRALPPRAVVEDM